MMKKDDSDDDDDSGMAFEILKEFVAAIFK
jgi:hypothetical protein